MLLRHIFALCLAGLLLVGGPGLRPATGQTPPGQTLTVGFRPTAPYVMQKADGTLTGLEYDLVMLAASAAGLTLRPQLAPFGRLPEDFRRRAVDAIVPANPAMNLPGCISDTVLVYRNLAISLRQRGLVITFVSDLARLDVTAFQNARTVLGPEVAALQGSPSRYREVANQMLQVRALFSGRTDAVLAERRIFRYLMRSPDAGVDITPVLTEHEIFPPTPYGIAFQRAGDCVAFNRGLAEIRRNGAYDAVLRRWEAAPPFG